MFNPLTLALQDLHVQEWIKKKGEGSLFLATKENHTYSYLKAKHPYVNVTINSSIMLIFQVVR